MNADNVIPFFLCLVNKTQRNFIGLRRNKIMPMTSYRSCVGSMWCRYKVHVLRCLYFSLTLFADRIESVQ